MEQYQFVRGNFMLKPHLDCNPTALPSDEDLVEAITNRQPEALNEFYSRHGGWLKSVVANVVHQKADADDVLQDILLQIWRQMGRYSPKHGTLVGWMVTLARRRAIDWLRRKRSYSRATDRYQQYLYDRPKGGVARDAVDDDVSRSDLRQFLNRRLELLPHCQREAVELAFLAGMSHREIATVTCAPLGTVKTRLELGLQKLYQSLRPLRGKI
jgi:RNA polymerase sigma-70 factor (ECF subfamily)